MSSTSRLVLPVLACVATLVGNFSALGEEDSVAPAKEFFPQPTQLEARLDAALDKQVAINFTETPLADLATWLSSKLEVPVILDHRSLEDAGVSSDTPVTRKVDGIRARTALKLTLGELDLTHLEQDGVLVITTQDKAESELITRVYPVGDLTPVMPVVPRKTGKMSNVLANSGMTSGPFNVPDESPGAHPPREQPQPAPEPSPSAAVASAPDFETLIEVIVTTVKPQTWDEVGGPGSITKIPAAKSVVVSQTRPVHDEILELLRALRAAKSAAEPNSTTDNR